MKEKGYEMFESRMIISVGFLGDKCVKFFLRDNTVQVEVSSLDHLLKGVVVSEFSQILGDLSEVLESNEPGLLGVEGDENLVDLISGLVIGGTSSHHIEELGEFDLSTAVLVEFGDHLIDGLSLGLNTE